MKSNNIASAIPLLRILKICGLWPWTEDGRPTQRILRLQMCHRFLLQDLEQAGDILYMSLTELALIVKMCNIWALGTKAFAYMYEIANDGIYELQTLQEHGYWQREHKFFKNISVVYIGISVGVAIFAFTGVLLLPDYERPFAIWTPFDWHIAHNYWILFVFECFAMPLTCFSNTALDMIQCYFLFHVALLYKLIGMRLRALQYLSEKEVLDELKTIFQLHRNVKRLTLQCEELISIPILAQIIFSALVLCFSGYRMQNLNGAEDAGRLFSMLQFLGVMALQIFLPCYYANEIIVNANELTTCVYSSNWQRLSVPTRKLLCLYMEFLKWPTKVKAGGFFEVGLPIFSSTMNNAYNFFAILLNMDN